MTVCANRTDSPGMFTSCRNACGGCICAREVLEEYADRLDRETAASVQAARELRPQLDTDPTLTPWTCPACGTHVRVRSDLPDVRCRCGVVSRAPEPAAEQQSSPVPAGLGPAAMPATTTSPRSPVVPASPDHQHRPD